MLIHVIYFIYYAKICIGRIEGKLTTHPLYENKDARPI
jgi:hypothetical protein